MHKIKAFILTLLYFVAMIRPAQPVLNYILNYDYIVNVLCINRDKPKLNCNGKCYLMKMIEDKQAEKPFDKRAFQMELYPIGFISILNLEFKKVSFYKNTIYSYIDIYNILISRNFDKPPQSFS
ncbi:hypothetical protein [Psychroflexus sp. MBR-150]